MANKKIYLVKTHGCSACKCMEHILDELFNQIEGLNLTICYCDNVPEFLKTNVPFTDFPTTVFVKDDVIKYHFAGTKSINKIKNIIRDIEF